jgi:hypothetical protein
VLLATQHHKGNLSQTSDTSQAMGLVIYCMVMARDLEIRCINIHTLQMRTPEIKVHLPYLLCDLRRNFTKHKYIIITYPLRAPPLLHIANTTTQKTLLKWYFFVVESGGSRNPSSTAIKNGGKPKVNQVVPSCRLHE